MKLTRGMVTGIATVVAFAAICAWIGVKGQPTTRPHTNTQAAFQTVPEGRQGTLASANQGLLQERAGHLAEAEATYRKVLSTSRVSLVRLNLAKLLDREGRGDEAMVEYKWLIDPPKGVTSSLSKDSTILCRYADYCLQRGSNTIARQMYIRAAKSCDDFLGDAMTPSGAKREDDEKTPILKLRSDAYFAVGVALIGQGEGGQGFQKMELALSLDPSSALARAGYAWAIMGQKGAGTTPQEQRWQAEQDATGPLKASIRKLREMQQELYASSSVREVDNKTVVTHTEYKPSRPVPTPHVPDPIAPPVP